MKLLFITSLIVIATITALTWRWFLQPLQHTPEQGMADAIVVFAGGRGERLDAAIELAESGVAPIIFANTGALPWPGQNATRELCLRQNLPYQVECVLVEADNTAGEALAYSQIALARDYKRLVVITSESHLTRASFLLSLYHQGEIIRMGSKRHPNDPALLSPTGFKDLIHEWGGLLYAATVERYRSL